MEDFNRAGLRPDRAGGSRSLDLSVNDAKRHAPPRQLDR